MAVPTINHLSIESHFMNFDDHFSRWSSSSSLCTSSSASRSTSSTGYPDCPTMSKSLTDSMSSDTQTENETPPESPNEASSHLQTTPVFHEAKQRHMSEYPHRPDFSAHVSMYSESGEEYDGSDAGYETECEDKHPILHTKRSTTRRKVLDRTSFRRRGELYHCSIPGPQTRPLPGSHNPPSAPFLGTSTRIAGQSITPSSSRRGSISRPGGPTTLELPKPSPTVFPSTGRSKAPIGLGLGLGLPSCLSDVRRSPNCVHVSNTDFRPPSQRSLVPVTHADLLLPLDFLPPSLPPTPLKPRLNPIPLSPTGDLSPLELESSSTVDMSSPSKKATPLSDSHAMPRPRHAAFCFSHGDGKPTDFCTTSYGATAAAFLTMANHAQTQEIQLVGSRRRIPKGPPSRGSPLPPMQEEVCPGDEARGIRRFAAMNPYFATMGYCVTSG